MENYIVYFDETGDDGQNTSSSDHFVLTSMYMSMNDWQKNYDKIKEARLLLKNEYGFHVSEEMHTKHFLSDKNPYRKYNWSTTDKLDILNKYIAAIGQLEIKINNIIIDKTKIPPNYNVLNHTFKYNIQRIENTSYGKWNYIIITDKGRISPMRKTAREIRVYNPIPQMSGYTNQPIKYLIEDILEKDSKESYFIQICDFVSYFIHLYYKVIIKQNNIPNRMMDLITPERIVKTLEYFHNHDILNLYASKSTYIKDGNNKTENKYKLVIYP